MRSVGGYSAHIEPDRGRLQTDARSRRFAAHVLSFGPGRHRAHEALGTYPTTDSCYQVQCSCGPWCGCRFDPWRASTPGEPLVHAVRTSLNRGVPWQAR